MVKLPPDQEVSGLSDDDLFQRLKDFGVDVGPIVGSTRILYERKLQKLLTGEEPATTFAATQDYEEDSEEDANEYALNDNAYHDSPKPEAYNVRYQQPISSSKEEYRNSESYIRSRPGLSSTPLQPSTVLRQEPPLKNIHTEVNSFGLVIKLGIVSFIAAFLLFIVYSNMENDQSNPVPSV